MDSIFTYFRHLVLIGAFETMAIITMTTMTTRIIMTRMMKSMTRTMKKMAMTKKKTNDDIHRWLPDEDLPSCSIPVCCSLSRWS